MIDRRGLALLVLGALLFAGVFYVATAYHMLGWPADGDEGSIPPQFLVALYTIAFGLPYALGELARRTNWLAIFYLIVLIPAAHLGAMYLFLWLTAAGQELSSPLMAGLLCGFAGSALSFLALFLLGLRASSAGLVAFGAGIVLLTGWGGVAMKLLPEEPESALSIILPLFLPWQLIFAFFLSVLLRVSPPRGAATTT